MPTDDRIVRLLEAQKALRQMKCLEMDRQSIQEVSEIIDKIPTLIARIQQGIIPESPRQEKGKISSRFWIQLENELGENTMAPVTSAAIFVWLTNNN